jgi:hypothetical protein
VSGKKSATFYELLQNVWRSHTLIEEREQRPLFDASYSATDQASSFFKTIPKYAEREFQLAISGRAQHRLLTPPYRTTMTGQ